MGFPTCSSVSERALPEVGVNTATGDVLIAPHSLRRVTRGLPTRDEHRRLNVEITPSVQQRRNVIPGFAHARLAVSVDRSPRWSVFGRWWERLLDDVIDDDNPHVEQLGGIPRRSGHVTCDDKIPRFECVYELPLETLVRVIGSCSNRWRGSCRSRLRITGTHTDGCDCRIHYSSDC